MPPGSPFGRSIVSMLAYLHHHHAVAYDRLSGLMAELFGIRISKVRTQNRLGKHRRYRFKVGRLSNWKKAIITLHPDSAPIEFF